jgi:hypothetical protein
MAKRKTIGRDPLSEGTTAMYSAEIVSISIPGVTFANDSVPPPAKASATVERPAIVVLGGKARRAVGGRLEILGGDLGTGNRVIWPIGAESSVGFIAPTGRSVDFGQELETVLAWPDHTEHRLLSAAGWAWVLASVGGVVGLLAGGGLRLLEPQRMIVKMQLSDGAKLVARTDSVTVVGLKALAGGRRGVTA